MCREEHMLSPKMQNQILSASEDLLLRCANDDKHAFAELYDALPRYLDGVPLTGGRSPGPAWLICVRVSMIRGVLPPGTGDNR